jgi:hypothetical protein
MNLSPDMLDRRSIAFAEPPPGTPPLLAVIVDTEEDFDWARPLARENTGVTSIAAQVRAQRIFARYGIVPTYVIDYPVASSKPAVRILREFLEHGQCEIGAHLHPWVNPPHEEEVNAQNSYPGNLPPRLERNKLERLTQKIEENFGKRPTVYKAGRYGVGPATARLLEDLGYCVDASVVPYTEFLEDGGPDFRGFGFRPYWFGKQRKMLELPLTCGFFGRARRMGANLYPILSNPLSMRFRAPGVFARLGILERIRLTPEGSDHAAHRRLSESLLKQGCRVFSFTYHSPSLEPGNTPYVRDQSDLSAFLDTMDRYFDYFMNALRGRPTTPMQLYEMLRR